MSTDTSDKKGVNGDKLDKRFPVLGSRKQQRLQVGLIARLLYPQGFDYPALPVPFGFFLWVLINRSTKRKGYKTFLLYREWYIKFNICRPEQFYMDDNGQLAYRDYDESGK